MILTMQKYIQVEILYVRVRKLRRWSSTQPPFLLIIYADLICILVYLDWGYDFESAIFQHAHFSRKTH